MEGIRRLQIANPILRGKRVSVASLGRSDEPNGGEGFRERRRMMEREGRGANGRVGGAGQ